MKKIMYLCGLLLVVTISAHAQEFKGLDASPLDVITFPTSNRETNKSARVLYSRPQLKGRDIASLVPEGKVWRMGANEATELTLYAPMSLGGTALASGAYTLYAIPNGEQMTIIVNTATNVWGAYSYDAAKDFVRVNVPIQESGDYLEAFSMAFEEVDGGAALHMGWGNYRTKVVLTKN